MLLKVYRDQQNGLCPHIMVPVLQSNASSQAWSP